MGFVAQTSQAIGELVGGELAKGQDKFKRAFTTLATKPMLGYKGRAENARQPRERMMGDARYDETSALRASASENRRLSRQLNKDQPQVANIDSEEEEESEEEESDIDDDHDDGDDMDTLDERKRQGRSVSSNSGRRRRTSTMVVEEDEALWRFFDAAAALCLCWGRHIGHVNTHNNTHMSRGVSTYVFLNMYRVMMKTHFLFHNFLSKATSLFDSSCTIEKLNLSVTSLPSIS